MIIETRQGLCNRLRVTFSYLMYAKSIRQPLFVYWAPCPACDGFFLDYFEPLPGVTFFKEPPPPTARLDYSGDHWHPHYNPYQTFIFNGLVLNARMRLRMERLWHGLGDPSDMVALHVRRTDHSRLAKQHGEYTEDQVFFDIIDRNPEKKVFLATDNAKTQDQFCKRYGTDRIFFQTPIHPQPRAVLRKTGLEEAVLDLWACVDAHDFKGSGYSSFSATIEQLRSDRRRKRLDTSTQNT